VTNVQPGILAPIPRLARYLTFSQSPDSDARAALAALAGIVDGAELVLGIGQLLVMHHDLDLFESKPAAERDNIFGRRRSDSEELADAPESAHVKRTAQESFDPETFVLRRSMPWADEYAARLNFVAFGESFDAFEAQLLRMIGAEDNLVDALFTFTSPVSGACFWCPPAKDGRLDLSRLKL